MSDMNSQVSLKPETLEILKNFALENGCSLGQINDNNDDILTSIHSYFEDPNKDDTFIVDYESTDGRKSVYFECKGIKRELGQTLSSTGLTIWRAAEHLCQWIMDNYELFDHKTCCELGGGLGMVSILLDKVNGNVNKIICSDGDDATIELLRENILSTGSNIEDSKLYWGELSDFLLKYPEPFDILLGADIIYEEEQILPLFKTIAAILKKPNGIFYLAFARRNVPMDNVLRIADNFELKYETIDQNVLEPIYSFTWI